MRNVISTVVVSCFEGESAFRLYCEPEGAVQEVAPGDVLTIAFEAAGAQSFEVSRVSDGIVLGRTTDADSITITDKRGRNLQW